MKKSPPVGWGPWIDRMPMECDSGTSVRLEYHTENKKKRARSDRFEKSRTEMKTILSKILKIN